MVYDRDETEYTITENGWEVGADRENGIEIWVRQTYQAEVSPNRWTKSR